MASMRPASGLRLLLAAALAVLPAAGETVRLPDGSVLEGEIVSRDDSGLVIHTRSLGKVRVPLPVLAPSPDSSGGPSHPPWASGGGRGPRTSHPPEAIFEPADHALFFMPTAFTPGRGSFTFRDFEILFPTFGYSPTSTTTVTGGFMFPISPEFLFLTAGFKQQLWREREGLIALAATGNITAPLADTEDDWDVLLNANGVVSFRVPGPGTGYPDALGFHAAAGYVATLDSWTRRNPKGTGKRLLDWDSMFSFALGAEARLTRNSKALVEFLRLPPVDGPEEGLHGGLLTLGVRVHGARLAVDVAGFRFVEADTMDEVILWPLLVITYRI